MKKTLLIAAAALAAGIISSEAQVYSQNIVGYANTVLAGNGKFTAVCNPLNAATNTADKILTSLQTSDIIYVWDTANNKYHSYTFIATDAGGPGLSFIDDNSAFVAGPVLNPGQGFFYATGSGSQETNTFVGSVVLSNSVALVGSGAFTAVASTPPIGGSVTSTNINLPFETSDIVYIWDAANNQYHSYTFIATDAGGPGLSFIDDSSSFVAAPTLTVGQGFFYATGSGNAKTWTQNLVVQ